MERPLNDSKDDQMTKYIVFKTAYGLVNGYEKSQNYIAAYVVAFSILEDRIKAMYVVSFREKYGRDPQPGAVEEGFGKLVNSLLHLQYVTKEVADELRAEAVNRNQMLHTAMWKLDAFTPESVKRVKTILRKIDLMLRKKKRELGLTSRVLTGVQPASTR